MERAIDRVLDGDLPREELTAAETIQLEREEALFRNVLMTIPEEPIPDVSRAVLQHIEAGQPSALQRILSWLWNPRSISLQWRPAYSFAVLVVLAATIAVYAGQNRRAVVADRTSKDPSSVLIQFRLDAPAAQQVALAGDFTDWQPAYELTRTNPGVWTIVVPLRPGVHEYAFIVDGKQWTPDPQAPAVEDGFGGFNSRVAVLSPDNRSL